MKRLIVRLTLLSAVIGLGTVAVYEAGRSLHPEDVAEPEPLSSIGRHEEPPQPIQLASNVEQATGVDYSSESSSTVSPTAYNEPVNNSPPDQLASSYGNSHTQYTSEGLAPDLEAMPADDEAPGDGQLTATTEGQQPAELNQSSEVEEPKALDPMSGEEQQLEGAGEEDWQDNFSAPATAEREASDEVAVVPMSSAEEQPAAPDKLASLATGPSQGTGRPGERRLEGAQAPSLTIEKRAPREIQVGKTATFSIIVRNTGQVPAQGVEVHDVIPQGTQLVGATPQAKRGANGELVWDLGLVKPASETTIQIQLMPLTEGEIGSVATIHIHAGASVRTTATRPQLAIEVAAPPRVMVGDNVTLQIKISNPGTGAATGVVITEAVPPELRHPDGRELEQEIGTLKPGQVHKIDLTLSAAQAGSVTNLLTARADGNVRVERRTPLEVIAPDLKVTMSGPKRRYLERSAVYNISVSNPGTAPAKDIELVAMLPKGLKFVEANNAGQYDSATGAVYWSLEELPPRESGTVTLTTLPTESGELRLRIKGVAKGGLADEREETMVVEGIAAILFEVVDVNDPIEVGGETTYEIRVINQGSKAASNVRLVALLPQQMEAISADGPARHVVDGRRVLFDPIGQLAPKADTTYSIKVKAREAGDLRLKVQVLTDELRKPVSKEESTHVYDEE